MVLHLKYLNTIEPATKGSDIKSYVNVIAMEVLTLISADVFNFIIHQLDILQNDMIWHDSHSINVMFCAGTVPSL